MLRTMGFQRVLHFGKKVQSLRRYGRMLRERIFIQFKISFQIAEIVRSREIFRLGIGQNIRKRKPDILAQCAQP